MLSLRSLFLIVNCALANSRPPVLIGAPAQKRNSFKLAVAGGLAGGTATLILYPIDSVKSLCQTTKIDPLQAFQRLFSDLRSLYSGVLPAALGAIPSSALYFGSYEYCKVYLASNFQIYRPLQHMLAAASGNLMSSAIFVPKDVLKHKIQAIRQGAVEISGFSRFERIDILKLARHVYATSGIKGFYPSYRATLMKNVPSAVIRFTLYEELKSLIPKSEGGFPNFWYMLPGGVASALSSAFCTPFDVVKTRIAAGMLPPGSPIIKAVVQIGRSEGARGLFAGVESRLLWSALFGGLGFTCFEYFKHALQIPE